MFTKRTIFIAVIAMLAVGAVGWRLYQTASPHSSSLEVDTDPANSSGDSQAASPSAGIGVEGSGKYTVETFPVPQSRIGLEYPSFRRPLVFSAVFSAEAQELMRRKIEASIAALEKNPRDFGEWTVLAMHRNLINDYEGARQVWEFLTTTNPDQPAPYANLASLYAFELKDSVRAEKNFTEALKKGPKEVSVYRNAYDFYRYVQKDDEKAKETLRKGIAETNSRDLRYLLDHYDDL